MLRRLEERICPFPVPVTDMAVGVVHLSDGQQSPGGVGLSDRAELDQAPDRVLVQRVLAGRVVEGHSVAVRQGAPARQHSRRRGRLLGREEVVVGVRRVVVVRRVRVEVRRLRRM